MSWFLYLPFLCQSIAIFFDEFYFHIKRGLPKWERIGHPLDTFSVMGCFLYVVLVPYTHSTAIGYCALAVFSSLFVTKDEWVHHEHCSATEQWLHAILFLNHPLAFLSAGLIWAKEGNEVGWAISWFDRSAFFIPFLTLQLALLTLFFFYQVIYWNIVWKEK